MKVYFLLFFLFCCAVADAQTKKISGTVVDEDKAPLAGVTVALGNKRSVTQTDSAGKFSISVTEGSDAKLVFSYTGHISQTVSASQGMVVTLAKNTASMEEVVVIGYGSPTAIKDLTNNLFH